MWVWPIIRSPAPPRKGRSRSGARSDGATPCSLERCRDGSGPVPLQIAQDLASRIVSGDVV